MRKSRFALPIAGASALLVLGAVGVPASAQPAADAPQAPKALAKNLTPVDEIPVQQAADEAVQVTAKYANSFGGAHWDAAAKVLYISLAQPKAKQADHRAELQASITKRLSGAKLGVTTKFRTVPLSIDQQNALVSRFMDERAAWGGQAAVDNIVGSSVDEVTGRISAGALADAATLQAAARKRFGDVVDIGLTARPQLQGRYNDTSPYATGDALWISQFADRSVGRAYCTAGFNWLRHSDGLRYMSMAGHCANPGTSVYHQSTTQRIGFVGTRYRNNNEYIDFEFIKMTVGAVSGTVWLGSPTTNDLRVVTTSDSGVLTGVTACSSGANGGLVCGLVRNRTAQVTFDGITTKQLTCVSNTTLTRGGDSGGPWLTTATDGSVKAWGQHIGTWNCAGDQAVDMVFATVKNIATRTGASLITGP
ncbi:chymotrypsin family serine protease [Kribbella endophytica]